MHSPHRTFASCCSVPIRLACAEGGLLPGRARRAASRQAAGSIRPVRRGRRRSPRCRGTSGSPPRVEVACAAAARLGRVAHPALRRARLIERRTSSSTSKTSSPSSSTPSSRRPPRLLPSAAPRSANTRECAALLGCLLLRSRPRASSSAARSGDAGVADHRQRVTMANVRLKRWRTRNACAAIVEIASSSMSVGQARA